VAKVALRVVALTYLLFLLVLPVGLICARTFSNGVGPVVAALTTPSARHAFQVTIETAIPAVLANTVFGVGVAVLLVRHRFVGRRALSALVDLPVAVSPVVVGLGLILVYGRFTPIGGWFAAHGIDIIFSIPGMILATIFVSLPLVVRAIAPVLEEIGIEQEQAAWTLGASARQGFGRVTVPAIKWALAYGMVLALARTLGEYGAVAVVSGNLVDQTQTLTLFVQDRFENFDQQSAYAASFALAAIAVVCLLAISLLRPKEGSR